MTLLCALCVVSLSNALRTEPWLMGAKRIQGCVIPKARWNLE